MLLQHVAKTSTCSFERTANRITVTYSFCGFLRAAAAATTVTNHFFFHWSISRTQISETIQESRLTQNF